MYHQHIVTKIAAVKIRFGISQPLFSTNETVSNICFNQFPPRSPRTGNQGEACHSVGGDTGYLSILFLLQLDTNQHAEDGQAEDGGTGQRRCTPLVVLRLFRGSGRRRFGIRRRPGRLFLRGCRRLGGTLGGAHGRLGVIRLFVRVLRVLTGGLMLRDIRKGRKAGSFAVLLQPYRLKIKARQPGFRRRGGKIGKRKAPERAVRRQVCVSVAGIRRFRIGFVGVFGSVGCLIGVKTEAVFDGQTDAVAPSA